MNGYKRRHDWKKSSAREEKTVKDGHKSFGKEQAALERRRMRGIMATVKMKRCIEAFLGGAERGSGGCRQ